MTDSEARRVASRLRAALELKRVARAGWARVGIESAESVAGHSWGVAWLALVLCPDTLDRGRVVEMAIVHDLPEVMAGDITPHDGISKSEKSARERAGLRTMTDAIPRANHVCGLWEEYEAGMTPESRFVKACDKLDMALQAQVYAHDGFDTAEFIQSAMTQLGSSELRALIHIEAQP